MKKYFYFIIFLLLCLTMLESVALADSLISRLSRIFGITATPRQLRGIEEDNIMAGGDIWLVNLDQRGIMSRIPTTNNGYRSPLFLPGDKSILALKGNNIVRISVANGEAETINTIKDVVKLVGFDKDDMDKLLVLIETKGSKPSLGILSLKSGEMSFLAYNWGLEEHQKIISHIKEWERDYGDIIVYPKTEKKAGMAGFIEFTDVYIKQGDKDTVNISRCNGINCGQPSLSHDSKMVVFIKATGLQ